MPLLDPKLDVGVHLHSGERVDVEMQARTDAILANRILYYAARDCADHVLQLPEISSAFAGDPTPAGRALYNWGRFFGAPDERTLARLAQEDDTMATAVKALENLSQDPETQRIARDREDSLRFYNMSLVTDRVRCSRIWTRPQLPGENASGEKSDSAGVRSRVAR